MDDNQITTDQTRFDFTLIHQFLTSAYWSENIPFETMQKAVQNSLSFAVFKKSEQIGFGRVITDYATFGYLADIFILDEYQGCGYGKLLVKTILEHSDLQGIRRMLLATSDAHHIYAKYNFKALEKPENFMEINVKNIYLRT